MKKTYLSPEISQLLGETEEMIAASSPEGFSGKLDDNTTIDDPNKMLSRPDIWDDED